MPLRTIALMQKLTHFRSRLTHYLKMSAHGLWADVLNRWSRASVVGDAPVVVSLTTHSIRIQRVHRTLESIARGEVKPQRLIVWLGLRDQGKPLPLALQRLQARGLEVRYAEDCGPHTKYFPYVCSEPRHRLAMVTADDDIWYPSFWLRELWRAHERAPDHVHCYRARRVRLRGDALALQPYETWPFMDDDRPGPTVFATGVGGVVYPPALLDRLRDAGTAFQQCCPKADDLWLHVTALRNGFVAKQLGARMQEFNTMPSTQSVGLQNENVAMARNDAQAALTYTAGDIGRMRAA